MENLRRDLRHAEEELAQTRRELEERKRQLRELRRALPLPDPERLYRNIVDLCHEFHLCTTRTTELDDRIKAQRRSTGTGQNRLHDVAFTELSVEKLRVEIIFIRSQLRTFFTAPALLCVTKVMTMDVWSAWIDRPHRTEAGEPLLVRQDDIERVAIDQLQQLDRQRHALIEIRSTITEENRQDSLEFQEQMRVAVSKVQSTLDSVLSAINKHSRDKPAVSLQEDEAMEEDPREDPPVQQESTSQRPSPAPEGIPMPDQEREAIEENAEFLEEIEAVEEEEEAMPQENLGERVRQENASIRRQIENEIRQLQQSCTNFQHIIEDLRKEPTYPPRRFGRGGIRNGEEAHMRCAFCRAVGQHYSDSCSEIKSVFVRRRMIEDRGKCVECLESCHGGKSCPKYYAHCHHCLEYDHHSALCTLPETSEEIEERLARARRGLAEAREKIDKLKRDLRFFQD